MSALPESEVISVEQSGHVATVWLDRPEKLNAMAVEFWTEFPTIIEALGDDPSVRCIVVAGRGSRRGQGCDEGQRGNDRHRGGEAGAGGHSMGEKGHGETWGRRRRRPLTPEDPASP